MPAWHVHVKKGDLETRADSAMPMSSQRWNREGEPIAAARFSCGRARGGVFEGRALCRSDIAGADAAEDVADLVADSRPTDHSRVGSFRMVNLPTGSMGNRRGASHRTTRISARKVGIVATITTGAGIKARARRR